MRYATDSLPSVEPQIPTVVTAEGSIAAFKDLQFGPTIKWSRAIERVGGKTTSKDAADLRLVSKAIQKHASSNVPTTFPLVSYYGTGRMWRQKRSSRNPTKSEARGRLRGYVAALDPASDIKSLNRWLRSADWTEENKNRKVSGARAIKAAVLACMTEFDDLRFDVEFGEMALVKRGGEGERRRWMPFHELSDGYRNLLGMVADIAYRAAVLNPHLGDDAAAETPGLILIDEIDLHLHPTWQRRVVDDLRRALPRVQFIASSHSPFIIQSLRPGELINLDTDARAEYANQSIEDIAQDVMGVEQPARSKVFLEKEEAASQYLLLSRSLPDAQPDEREGIEHRMAALL